MTQTKTEPVGSAQFGFSIILRFSKPNRTEPTWVCKIGSATVLLSGQTEPNHLQPYIEMEKHIFFVY